MSVGFKKELFGFNRDDVMTYIESSHKSYLEKEAVLNERISALEEEIAKKSSELIEVRAQSETVKKELAEYTDKYEEIERLSQNIGKLYIVAQSNARAILSNSKSNLEMSKKEVEKNISTIDEAHTSLDAIKEDILKTSSEFAVKIEQLLSSLEDTKSKISSNDESSEQTSDELDKLLTGISK